MDYMGISYLRNKLASKRGRVADRYEYYELKNKVRDLGVSTPPNLRNLQAVTGWCSKAVDSLADRLQYDGFEKDVLGMQEIYSQNNPDVLFDSAILSALISSCCFLYISQDEGGYPRLQVIDGGNATGIIDPITYLLSEGYAVLERDTRGNVTKEAYFVAGRTDFGIKTAGGWESYSIENKAPDPLLVPVIYRPDAVRPFGHSRISRACMSYVDGAIRSIKRSEISAEFYSFPQKYVVGTSPDQDPLESWRATMASLIEITKDEDGDRPTMGQFQQATMAPHVDHVKMFASLFAGETGLTLDDLGFSTDNPASADAIKAGHENLRLAARKSQRTFGVGFVNAGYLAACLRDGLPYKRYNLSETRMLWTPLFEPDAGMLSGIGDGAIKINQAVPGYFDSKTLKGLTGIEPGEASE